MSRRSKQPAVGLLALHLTALLTLLGGLGTLVVRTAPPAALPAAAPASAPSSLPLRPTPGEGSPPLRPRQNLVVLGDSVPAATACSCPGFGTDLARSVQPADLTNAAESGLTSQGLLVQLSSPAVIQALGRATVVTVTVGANDFDDSLAAGDSCLNASCYAPTLREMNATMTEIANRLDTLTQPGAKVVLTGYWNVFRDGAVGSRLGPNYVATSDTLTRQVNAALAKIAARAHLQYADLYAPFKGDGSRDDTALLASDGDHPDADGHALIAAVIATAADLATLQ